MNAFVTWLHPAPSCTLPRYHPSRAHIPASHTDVSKTWEQHRPVHTVGDDYDDCERTHHLDFIGGFR